MTERGKKSILIILALLSIGIGFVVYLGSMRDAPVNYSNDNPELLSDRIRMHKRQIGQLGKASSALDADRYWPYDLDRTVRGMMLFRMQKDKWPRGWEELKESGMLDDPDCIHSNWRLDVEGENWSIRLEDRGKIAYYNNE